MGMVKRFEVYLINLDPTIGVEIHKRRPCLINFAWWNESECQNSDYRPDDNQKPKLSKSRFLRIWRKNGFVVLDQIRAVDKTRLGGKLGEIEDETQIKVLEKLQEMFAP